MKGTIESVINVAVHLLIFEKKISRCYVLIKGGYANQFLDFLHFLFLLKTIVVVPGYMLYMLFMQGPMFLPKCSRGYDYFRGYIYSGL